MSTGVDANRNLLMVRRLRQLVEVYGVQPDIIGENYSKWLGREDMPEIALVEKDWRDGEDYFMVSLHYNTEDLLEYVENLSAESIIEPWLVMGLDTGGCWQIERHWTLMPGPFTTFNGKEQVKLV